MQCPKCGSQVVLDVEYDEDHDLLQDVTVQCLTEGCGAVLSLDERCLQSNDESPM